MNYAEFSVNYLRMLAAEGDEKAKAELAARLEDTSAVERAKLAAAYIKRRGGPIHEPNRKAPLSDTERSVVCSEQTKDNPTP